MRELLYTCNSLTHLSIEGLKEVSQPGFCERLGLKLSYLTMVGPEGNVAASENEAIFTQFIEELGRSAPYLYEFKVGVPAMQGDLEVVCTLRPIYSDIPFSSPKLIHTSHTPHTTSSPTACPPSTPSQSTTRTTPTPRSTGSALASRTRTTSSSSGSDATKSPSSAEPSSATPQQDSSTTSNFQNPTKAWRSSPSWSTSTNVNL
jgi:hypothetical protein